MTYLFSLLLLVSIASSKSLEIPIRANVCYTYIDNDNNGVFDSLMIVKDNDTTIQILNQVSNKPSKIEFNQSTFDVRLINYNDTYKDAYFRINLIFNGKLLGYYEHNYGKKELIYKGVE